MAISFSTDHFDGIAFQVDDLDSVAPLFFKQPKRGLYRLIFDNGEMYVGQAENVVNRYAQHRRRWEDIVGLEFFPIPEPQPLLPVERILITESEQCASLRNVVDTRRPRGEKTYTITTEQGETIALPWDRAERKRVTVQPSKTQQKFHKLARDPFYPATRYVLGWLMDETLPDPVHTEKLLWSVSALPSTNKTRGNYRLACLSTGNIESVFTAVADNDFGVIYINTVPLEDIERYQDPEGFWAVERVEYPIATTWA